MYRISSRHVQKQGNRQQSTRLEKKNRFKDIDQKCYTEKLKNWNNSRARLFQMQWDGPARRPTNARSCDGMRMGII
jgi:hypothetical protein